MNVVMVALVASETRRWSMILTIPILKRFVPGVDSRDRSTTSMRAEVWVGREPFDARETCGIAFGESAGG